MPTSREAAHRFGASARRARAVAPPRPRRSSSMWRPQRRSGFSIVNGSWRTRPICVPRSCREVGAPAASEDLPSVVGDLSRRAETPSGRRPSIALAVSDLPLPDSPTIPIVSPAARRERQLPDDRARSARRSRLSIRRPRTSSSGRRSPQLAPGRRAARTASRPRRFIETAVSTSTRPGASADHGFVEEQGARVGEHPTPVGRARAARRSR